MMLQGETRLFQYFLRKIFFLIYYFVSEDSSDQVDGIVRHSSPAWVNLNINQMKHYVKYNYRQMASIWRPHDECSWPQHVSSEHTLLVLEATQAGAKGRDIPLSHVKWSVHNGLAVLLGGLLHSWVSDIWALAARCYSPGISRWPRTQRWHHPPPWPFLPLTSAWRRGALSTSKPRLEQRV